MSTLEVGQVAAPEPAAELSDARWQAVRRISLCVYAAALVAWSAHYGIPVQRELVVAWICGALLCASVGRPPREALRMIADWLPLVAVLCAYDFSRGAADSLGIGAHAHPMIDFDRFVFGGEVPSQWLQAHLYRPGAVMWWDVGFTLVYTSYFIVPFAVAGVLYARDRLIFIGYAKRLVTLVLAGLATYIAFPATPPWLAEQEGLIQGVSRTTARGWEVLGTHTAGWFSEGQAGVNLVAAVPSLHAGITSLVSMFLWKRVRPAWRPLLVLYPLAMALTLMATGEHYFFDILLGWCYAAAVMAGWRAWEAHVSRRRIWVGEHQAPAS